MWSAGSDFGRRQRRDEQRAALTGQELVPPEITVVYPTYNEVESVQETITRSVAALAEHFASFEILIVDDGSTDGTALAADALAAADRRIRVIHNPRNLGQGESLRRGFAEARGKLIMHNSMDYPFDLADLPRLLAPLDGADIVVATRRTHAGYTLYRKIISRTNLFLIRSLFRLQLRDYNFVQIYRREVLDRVRADSRSAGFFIPEVLIRAHDLGFRIRQVDADYHPRVRGKATAGRPGVVLRSAFDLFRFWVRRCFGRR